MTQLTELAWTQSWQVTAVAAGVGLSTRLFCRHRPHLAHILWLVVLVKCITPPLWSSPTSLFSWANRESAAQAPAGPFSVVAETRTGSASESVPAAQLGFSGNGEVPPAPARLAAGPSASDAVPRPAANLASRLADIPFAVMLGIVWIIGTLAYAGYAVVATIHCLQTISSRRIPAEESLRTLALDLSQRLGIRRMVRLWVTREPFGPLAFGWLRPTVVLPEALAAHRSARELEPLLAHELVHVRRGDSLVGLLQIVAQSLWWFHPLIWWTNRRIDFERERCCDEEVVANLGFAPARYARSLLNVLELKQQLRWPAASPGARPFEVTQRRLENIMLRGARVPEKNTPRLLAHFDRAGPLARPRSRSDRLGRAKHRDIAARARSRPACS